MSHTDWPKITDIVSIVSAMNTTLGTNVSSAVQQQVLDSTIESVYRQTNRLFIPIDDVKYYDGSDTGVMEIDEFITVTSCEVVGWFGVTPGMQLANVFPVQRVGFPKTKIQIYQGSVPALLRLWLDKFPAGRSNIKVTANWGYDTTIPNDLWLSVAYRSASILLNWKSYKTSGFLVKAAEADVTMVRQHMDPFTFFKAGMTFEDTVEFYSKPSSYFIRKQKIPLM